MIKQNDKDCLPIVQKIGCFVRSCGAMAEFKTGKELTAEQINALWDWAKKSGHINANNCVKHSAPIATRALRMLGDNHGQFIEIATFTKGRMNYYGSVTEDLKVLPKSFIQKIKTECTAGTHFRIVGSDGSVMFDPYEPPIKALDIYYSIVYAYKG